MPKRGRPKGSIASSKVFSEGDDNSPRVVSLKDISAIIKLASKYNIAKVTLGDFSVSFRSQSHGDLPNVPLSSGVMPTDESSEESSNTDKTAPLSALAVFQDEAYKAQLMMEDPQAYEQLMIDAERERTPGALSENTNN